MEPNAIRAVQTPASLAARAGSRALTLIALFKLAKAILFFAAAIGLFRMVHKDTQTEIKHLLQVFRISGDSVMMKGVLAKANHFDAPKKMLFSALSAFYAALFTTEGVGLLMKKRWAEYFTIVLTCTGVPIELYEIWRKNNSLKMGILVINVIIIWFLISHLSRGWHAEKLLHDQLAAQPEPEEAGSVL